MPLPPVAFYSIRELSTRWGRFDADIAGWAVMGHLKAVIGIPPVHCGDALVGGLVEVGMADLMPLFRRSGTSDEACMVKRILPSGGDTWLWVTDPAEGILVRASDLMFTTDRVHQFEEERGLVDRSSHHTGKAPRYEWDAMYAWLFRRVYERGLPESKSALVGEVQDWFIANAKTRDVPEESTIRKRISALWHAVCSVA